MNYKLASGVEQHQKSPETFWIPSDSKKSEVSPGDFVKLVFEGQPRERMWVRVTARDGDSISGTLSNTPRGQPGLKYGAVIEFGPDHIIEIIKS